MAYKIYRQANLGKALQESIDEINQNGSISEQLEEQILMQFDRSFVNALENKVRAKATFKGHCHTYQEPGPGTYSFLIQNVEIKIPHENLDTTVDNLKLICPEYQKKKEKKEEKKRKKKE